MKQLLLIDADPIVYRAAYAAQTRSVWAVVDCEGDGQRYVDFTTREGRQQWLNKHKQYCKVLGMGEDTTPKSAGFAREVTLGIIGAIKKRYPDSYIRLVLSASKGQNFRHAIAKHSGPYKGTRKDKPRPHHYETVRQYLWDMWDTVVATTNEADDEISVRAHALRHENAAYVVASLDKDLDQIPGRHYDYAKKVEYFVSEEDGKYAFWKQVLSGDPVDNVPGVWQLGPKKAERLVQEWAHKEIREEDLFSLVIDEYSKSKRIPSCPYASIASEELALETARLVYLQQTPCELWTPPGTPRLYIEGCKDDNATKNLRRTAARTPGSDAAPAGDDARSAAGRSAAL